MPASPKNTNNFDPLTPPLHRFLDRLTLMGNYTDEVLNEMERRAERDRFPIVGPLVGTLLFQITAWLRPRRVMELGSGFGYSAYWIARGLPEDAELMLTDRNAENLQLAEYYLDRGGFPIQVRLYRGDALNALEEQPEASLDLVFLDLDKARYREALDLALPRLRPGGALLADNVLLRGRVLTLPDREEEDEVRAMRSFLEKVYTHPRCITTLFPIRDGVSLTLIR